MAYDRDGRAIWLESNEPRCTEKTKDYEQVLPSFQPLDELFESPLPADCHRDAFTATHGTILPLLVFEGIGIDGVITGILHNSAENSGI